MKVTDRWRFLHNGRHFAQLMASSDRRPRKPRGKSIAVASIGFVLGLIVTVAVPAYAATSAANGSQYSGAVYYGTQRYHIKSLTLKYKLKTYTGVCGGGNFVLRPLRTNHYWMASEVYWPFGHGTHAPNSTKTWAAANTVASGNFTLWGNLISSCGAGPTPHIAFKGDITY